MADKIEKFSDDELQRGTDLRGLRPFLLKLALFFNAFLNFQIVTNSGKNALTITESNVTLELNITAAGTTVAAPNNNWRPYATPWTGQGVAPADWGLHVSIMESFVAGLGAVFFPSNANADFTVPANCTTGYYGWLVATLDPPSGSLTALTYGGGTTLPTQNASDLVGGTLPATVYLPLFRLTSTATGVDNFDARFVQAPLTLLPVVANYTGDTATRAMQWQALTGEAAVATDLFILPPASEG